MSQMPPTDPPDNQPPENTGPPPPDNGPLPPPSVDKPVPPPSSLPRTSYSTPPSPSAPVARPVEPAQLPRGFWAGVDYMLHHREEILESLRRDDRLWPLAVRVFVVSVIMAALYGAVMGATNLLQNSPLPLHHKLAQIGITAVKVPVLFLLTLVVVLPPVYVSNTFLGTRLSFRQVLTLLLASTAVTTTVLASMASVAFFFSLTSRSYDFLKLLHVIFFTYAGLSGVTYLQRGVDEVAIARGGRRTGNVFVLMLLLYVFVGTQLAWVLRPFVSSPGEPFQVFRPRTGNFYESVARSAGKLVQPEKKP